MDDHGPHRNDTSTTKGNSGEKNNYTVRKISYTNLASRYAFENRQKELDLSSILYFYNYNIG